MEGEDQRRDTSAPPHTRLTAAPRGASSGAADGPDLT
jgi:hypothetical protein